MASILVFAIDWVPGPDDVATGGGLRSLQVIEALRGAGHDVRAAVPRRARAVQALAVAAPQRLRGVDLFDSEDQTGLIRQAAPDLVVWLWPSTRGAPFQSAGGPAYLFDLNGLQDHEYASGTPALLAHGQRLIAQSCLGADMVLTGSPEQHGYWLSQLGQGPAVPATCLAPYALPSSLRGPAAPGPARLGTLHVIGNLYAWNATLPLLARAARWAVARGDVALRVIGGIDPGGATRLDDLEALRGLEHGEAVKILPPASLRATLCEFGPGSLCLDLYEPGTERDLAVPIRTVNALSQGVPVLTTIDSPFTRRLAAAGAAIIAPAGSDGIERALSQAANLPAEAFGAMATAAREFADREFNAPRIAASICEAAAEAIVRRGEKLRRWQSGTAPAAPLGHILVISGEGANLRDLRVDLPFSTLQRRRLISGYSVWHEGAVTFSTSAAIAALAFDAIWVQRGTAPEILLLLDALGLPFIYDIDDNLLVSPTYRDAFPPERLQAARNFVRRAAVLSCSTAAMAPILQRYASVELLHKTVVTPNLIRHAPPARPAGDPTCIVWVSSDTPALSEGRTAVLKAMRDFALTHALRIVCIGNAPPDLLAESAVEIEHIGIVPYPSYLEILRSLAPAILVCPLETGGDPATQDFINCKSDIKILEALSAGLVPVCSAARPYLESDLPRAILCANDYRGWFEGLARARHACREAEAAPPLPATRLASAAGPLAYFEALARARLPAPLPLAEFTARLRLIESRLEPSLVPPERFDEAFYLATYPDVRGAIENGAYSSGYRHYAECGFAEGRQAHAQDRLNPHAEQWWANLTNSVSDLKTAIETRGRLIEEMKTRRAARLRLREPNPR